MERISFSKYQGTGNDFIIINDNNLNHDSVFYNTKRRDKIISKITNRRFGVGADGIIIIKANHSNKDNNIDFDMLYFNADGSQSLCGNGARCAVKYAHQSGIIKKHACTFNAYDGLHNAEIGGENIQLKMNDVTSIKNYGKDYFVDTGSPHHIVWVDDTKEINVEYEGKIICNSDIYAPKGTNVNFVHYCGDNRLRVRTYERGVNRETYSCGTGVTASAIAASETHQIKRHVFVDTLGGELEVKFNKKNQHLYTSIYLIGPAIKVYDGVYDIK